MRPMTTEDYKVMANGILRVREIAALKEFEQFCLEPSGDPFEVAWKACELAHGLSGRDLTVENFAARWECYRTALYCEALLAKQDRTTCTESGGDTAADRIKRYLNRAASAALSEVGA